MSNAFELLRSGFSKLNEQTEQEITEKLKNVTDDNERKHLENKLKDVKKMQEEKEAPKEETMAEAMARRSEQRQKNDELSKEIKKFVVDGKTGQLVEVAVNGAGNNIKK